MQKCKNDSTQYFNGNEDSPLGIGYCATAEKEDTTKQGKDGNLWIVKISNKKKEWEEFQTYPYISIILWINNFKKEFKNFISNVESPECFDEIKFISNELDKNEVSYELGWTEHEIDFELFDNFDLLNKDFFDKIKNIHKLTFDNQTFQIVKCESVLLSLKDDEEQVMDI